MLRKIILPLVLLIFAQQNFYGMKKRNLEILNTTTQEKPTEDTTTQEKPTEDTTTQGKPTEDFRKYEFWESVNSYMNQGELWLLWAFLDNVPFQYGNSKIWKHGEAYYGLSNGIGFFPSALNFGWLKIGIGDAHINVINTIIKFMKTYTAITYNYYFNLKKYSAKHENPVWLNSLKWWLFYTVVTDIHLFSFNFFNCVKIKIISIGAVVTAKIDDDLLDFDNPSWYFSFRFTSLCEQLKVPVVYFILSPRIEINIPGIIDYFRGQ